MPTGPDPEAITRTIRETYPETDVVAALGATFFSLDPEKHWPNFATIVTTDEHDVGTPSNLARPGVFRVNVGVGRTTFQRLVGSMAEPEAARPNPALVRGILPSGPRRRRRRHGVPGTGRLAGEGLVIRRHLVVSVAVLASLAVGCGSAATPSPTAIPSVAATAPTPAAASPTVRPSAAPSVGPSAAITSLTGGERSLAAGTYRLELPHPAPGFPPVRFSVPDGWFNSGRFTFRNGPGGVLVMAMQFWDVGQVYGHPCKWQGTLFEPGPTVDDLAKALVGRPLRSASKPTAVTLAGFSGTYLEWSVPADIDFSDCDTDAGTHYFESWTGPANDFGGDRYHQGPGQIDRVWILDVRGARFVIDAFSMPSATASDIENLMDVVHSVEFEP